MRAHRGKPEGWYKKALKKLLRANNTLDADGTRALAIRIQLRERRKGIIASHGTCPELRQQGRETLRDKTPGHTGTIDGDVGGDQKELNNERIMNGRRRPTPIRMGNYEAAQKPSRGKTCSNASKKWDWTSTITDS